MQGHRRRGGGLKERIEAQIDKLLVVAPPQDFWTFRRHCKMAPSWRAKISEAVGNFDQSEP